MNGQTFHPVRYLPTNHRPRQGCPRTSPAPAALHRSGVMPPVSGRRELLLLTATGLSDRDNDNGPEAYFSDRDKEEQRACVRNRKAYCRGRRRPRHGGLREMEASATRLAAPAPFHGAGTMRASGRGAPGTWVVTPVRPWRVIARAGAAARRLVTEPTSSAPSHDKEGRPAHGSFP